MHPGGAEKRRDHSFEQNVTNVTLKQEKLAEPSNAGCFYDLPTEYIIEFQEIALKVAGMKLTYKEAWEAGHSLINYFDILLRNDNEK